MLASSEFLKELEERRSLKVRKKQKAIMKAAEGRKEGSKGWKKKKGTCNSWSRQCIRMFVNVSL